MAEWVSFPEIKARVSIADILGHYGLLEGLRKQGKHTLQPILSGAHPSVSVPPLAVPDRRLRGTAQPLHDLRQPRGR